MKRLMVATVLAVIWMSATAPIAAAPPVPDVTTVEWVTETVGLGGCELHVTVAWEKWPGGKKTAEMVGQRIFSNGDPFEPIVLEVAAKGRSGSVVVSWPQSNPLVMAGFRVACGAITGEWYWPGPDATAFSLDDGLRCGESFLWP